MHYQQVSSILFILCVYCIIVRIIVIILFTVTVNSHVVKLATIYSHKLKGIYYTKYSRGVRWGGAVVVDLSSSPLRLTPLPSVCKPCVVWAVAGEGYSVGTAVLVAAAVSA